MSHFDRTFFKYPDTVKDMSKSMDEINRFGRVNSKTTCCWLRMGEGAAPVKPFQQTRTELTPQQGNGMASVHG